MNLAASPPTISFPHRNLLGIEGLNASEIVGLLDLADAAVAVSRQIEKKKAVLRGRTQINLFFEASTRTQSSFEIAGKRLGAGVMNMAGGAAPGKKSANGTRHPVPLNARPAGRPGVPPHCARPRRA